MMYTVYSEPAAGRCAMRSVTRYTVRMLERTIQTVKDYVIAHVSCFMFHVYFLPSHHSYFIVQFLHKYKVHVIPWSATS